MFSQFVTKEADLRRLSDKIQYRKNLSVAHTHKYVNEIIKCNRHLYIQYLSSIILCEMSSKLHENIHTHRHLFYCKCYKKNLIFLCFLPEENSNKTFKQQKKVQRRTESERLCSLEVFFTLLFGLSRDQFRVFVQHKQHHTKRNKLSHNSASQLYPS